MKRHLVIGVILISVGILFIGFTAYAMSGITNSLSPEFISNIAAFFMMTGSLSLAVISCRRAKKAVVLVKKNEQKKD